MIELLISVIVELLYSIESSSDEVVDSDWAVMTFERAVSMLKHLNQSDRDRLRSIIDELCETSRTRDGYSARTQFLFVLSEDLEEP